jgi:uncharacterized protein with PQ loop repeat
MKEVLGIVAVILTFIGYAPYIRDTMKGKTRPHVYSWFLYSLIAFLVFAIQLENGAGPGMYITFAAGCFSVLLFFLGLRLGEKDITSSDTLVLLLTFIAIGFWLFAKQPVISILLACLVDLLAFLPTIRKTWHKPYTETLSLYTTNFVRYIIAIAALSSFTFVNLAYPVFWLLANGLFAIGLILRRRYTSLEIP